MAAGLVPPLAFYQSAVRCSSHHIPRYFLHFLGSEFRQNFSVSGFLDTYLSEDPLHSTHHQDLAITFQAYSDFSDSFWRLDMQLLKWQQWFFINSLHLSSHNSCYFTAQVSLFLLDPSRVCLSTLFKKEQTGFFSVCFFIVQNAKIRQGFCRIVCKHICEHICLWSLCWGP